MSHIATMESRNPSVSEPAWLGLGRRPTTNGVELTSTTTTTGAERFREQVRQRQRNDRAVIENPLAHLSDEELVADVHEFHRRCLPFVKVDVLLRAARVAKDIRTYDEVARGQMSDENWEPSRRLDDDEKAALQAEKDNLFSQGGMFIVILTVSLAAILQGHVQSSLNGSAMFPEAIGLSKDKIAGTVNGETWQFGAANAAPFLFAAVVGCPLALPLNDLLGRRGAMVVAALLILVSSLVSPFMTTWSSLFAVRIVNGLG